MPGVSQTTILETRLTKVETEFGNLQEDVNSLAEAVEKQGQRTAEAIDNLGRLFQEEKDRSAERRSISWPTISAIGGAIMASIGTAAAILAMYANMLLLPVQRDISALDARATSIERDVARDHESMSILRNALVAYMARTDAMMVEIETQFTAQSQVTNMLHNSNDRHIQALWEKVFGASLPGNTFYPSIGHPTRAIQAPVLSTPGVSPDDK